jgi:aminopeptidase N
MWLKLLVFIAFVVYAAEAQKPRKLFKTFDEDEEQQQSISRFTDPFDGKDYRLPNNTRPINYNIWLTTDVHRGEFEFDGRVTILFEVLENSTEITLHSRQLTIVGIRFLQSTGGTIQSNVPFEEKEDVEFLVIKPTRRLVEGTQYQVEVTYKGTLRTDDAGFYRSSYVNTAGQTVWLATTQFESTGEIFCHVFKNRN